MSKWKEVIIGDHIDLISGFAFKSPDFLEEQIEGSLPIIKIKNVANGDVNLKDIVFHKYNPILEKYLLCKGDVLIAMTGNHPQAQTQVVGDVSRYKLKEKSLLNQRVGKLIVKDDTNLDFIYYLFKNDDVRFYLANQSSGSANQANISKTDILGLNLTIPLPNEQTAIASVLSSLDDKIDLMHRQNDTLEKIAETLFRQWFVEETKEDWEEVELSNLIDVIIDNRGKTPPTVEFETEYPLIEVNALNSQSCLVDYTVIRKYVTKETFDTWFRKHLKVNDIIISTVGTIGVFSIHLANKGCIAQNLVGLRSSKVSSYFLYCFFKSNVETLINLDIGGVQPSIKVPHLLGLTIKLPPNDLLNKFNESVEICFNKIAINQTQIRILTALRDNLLPKLMSGEVTINF